MVNQTEFANVLTLVWPLTQATLKMGRWMGLEKWFTNLGGITWDDSKTACLVVKEFRSWIVVLS